MNKLAAVAGAALLVAALAPTLAGQDALSLKGEIVEVSCFQKMGVAKGAGPEHVACALDCAKKGRPLALLSEGEGLFKITGPYAENNSQKLLEFVGKYVEIRGTRDRYSDYSAAINAARIVVTKKPE